MFSVRYIIALVFLGVATAAKLPDYITACKKSEISTCALTRAKEVYSRIMQGDKKYGVPSFHPLNLPLIEIISPSLQVKLLDLKISGVPEGQLEKVNFDLDKKKITATLVIPNFNILSNYDVNGKILVLPITGNGKANITLAGVHFDYSCDISTQKKDGVEYLSISNPQIDYKVDKGHFFLENLFGGDEKLGTEMNKFLNENDQEVLKDIGKAVSEAISKVATDVLKKILEIVPYDDIFLN